MNQTAAQNHLTLAADALRRAGGTAANAIADRVKRIRDAVNTGDDTTARDDLTAVLDDLAKFTAAPPHVTGAYAATIEKQPAALQPGADRAINRIEKAIALLGV